MHRFIHIVHGKKANFYVNRLTEKANMCFVKNVKTTTFKTGGHPL